MQTIINSINNSIENTKVYDVIEPTDLDFADNLSARFVNNIYLKREDTTKVNSFKIRGAYQKIASLSKQQLNNGVITASAGNHAQGVAFSANKLGIKSTIVMPINTPKIKVEAVKNFGGKVILAGDVFDDAYTYAKQLEKQQNLVFIHPFDDKEVIAGQGTIAKEILKQLSNIDIIFVPVGGGGLISGIASFVSKINNKIKVIGVEPENTPTLHHSLQQNKRIILNDVDRFADGVAAKQLGQNNFAITTKLIDEVILVSNDEICAAIKDIYNDTRAIAEPSGALATAGIKKYIRQTQIKNQNLVAIVSGGNMNFNRLRYIAERTEIGEKTEAIFAATIDEKPGSFLNFCKKLNNHSITEFNYRFASVNKAHIFVGISIDGIKEKQQLLTKLKSFDICDLSENSIAKTHIRYMVGGKANTGSELLYRFEFPEKPGALLNFLIQISGKWNISLFHYRNHSSAFGRVLVGFQTINIEKLEATLDNIGYIYHNESDNKAYKFFL